MTDEPANHSDATKPLADARSDDDADEAFEQRLQAIEAKAKAAREEHARTLEAQEGQKRLDGESARGLGFGLAIAYTIVGFPLAMTALGWWVDRATDSNVFLSLFALIGSVLGIAVAMVLINKHNAGQ